MISNNSQISLTYTVGGESLAKAGVYSNATENKSMVVISQPVYNIVKQQVMLPNAFVQMCIERPKKPRDRNTHWWLRSREGRLYANWNRLSEKERISQRVIQYVEDMDGSNPEWELL